MTQDKWDRLETERVQRALSQWRWRGNDRPAFAEPTAHPPTFYLPLCNVQQVLLRQTRGGSVCEWKGPARYWDLVQGDQGLAQVAWSYPQPLAGAEPLADCIAFYAHDLQCTVGGAEVVPQAGSFYGGWITPDLAGPFKGGPGSTGW